MKHVKILALGALLLLIKLPSTINVNPKVSMAAGDLITNEEVSQYVEDEVYNTFMNTDVSSYQWQLALSYLGDDRRCFRVASDFSYDYFGQPLYPGINVKEISKDELQFGDFIYYEWINEDFTHIVVYLEDDMTLSGNTQINGKYTTTISPIKSETAKKTMYLRVVPVKANINIACEYNIEFGYEDVKGTEGCSSVDLNDVGIEYAYNYATNSYTNLISVSEEWKNTQWPVYKILYSHIKSILS